jgi:hypothetical protein
VQLGAEPAQVARHEIIQKIIARDDGRPSMHAFAQFS